MKKSIWKRLLSLALALVLVVSMLPHLTLNAEAARVTSAPFETTVGRYTVSLVEFTEAKYERDLLAMDDGVYFFYAGDLENKGANNYQIRIGAATKKYTTSATPVTSIIEYVSFTDTACDEALETYATIKRTGNWTFTVKVKITRAAGNHTGSATCTESATCTVCSESYTAPCSSYRWKQENGIHWQECTVNASHTANRGTCSGGTANCTTPAVCSTCKNSYGITNNTHSWGNYTSDGAYHWQICSHNSSHTTERVLCSGGTATCTATAVCSVCNRSYGSKLSHNYNYSVNDNVLTETCPNGCGHSATATLSAEDQTYTGSAITAATITYSDNWMGSKPTEITYTDNVNVGTATASITVEGQTLSTTFQITAASIADATVTLNPESGTYTGTAYAPEISVAYNGMTLAEGVDYTFWWYNTGLTEVGAYIVNIYGEGNFAGSTTKTFTINAASLSDITVEQVGTLTYTGEAQTPTVFTSATAVNGQTVTFTYLYEDEDGESDDGGRGGSYGALPQFTEAGTYTVKYKASAPNHESSYGEFTVTVDKAVVIEPDLGSVPYNGEVQRADIEDNDIYRITHQHVGAVPLKYNHTLKLNDPENYKWSTTDDDEVNVYFEITKAENAWITEPSISGWTYGETANAPTYEAKFGEVTVVYTGTANDGTAYNSETAPAKAGSYVATFTVEDEWRFSGLSAAVDFAITPIDASIDGITVDNVTSADQAAIEEVLAAIEAALENETLPEEELSVLEEMKLDVQELLDTIDAVAEVIDTALETVSDHNAKTVTSADKKELKEAVGDIDALLEGDNLTEQERAELEEAKADAEELIKKIDQVAERISDLTEQAAGYEDSAVTSADKETVQQIVDKIDELLEGDNLTKKERTELEEVKALLKEQLSKLEEAQQAANTQAVEQVKDITADNATSEDREALENAKADLEAALENYGDRYTQEEKAAMEASLQRINGALTAIAEAEAEKEAAEEENLILMAPAADEPAERGDTAVAGGGQPEGGSYSWLWILPLILAICAIIVILALRKKKKEAQ